MVGIILRLRDALSIVLITNEGIMMKRFYLMINGADFSGEFFNSLEEAEKRAQANLDEFLTVVGKESTTITWHDAEGCSASTIAERLCDEDESPYYFQILEAI